MDTERFLLRPSATPAMALPHAPIGVLGGMGPAATADFLAQLVALTPASCDQDHLPVVVASLPQVPDRSHCIVAGGASPLPQLLAGIALLNKAQPRVVVVASNTAHHWFDAMQAECAAPMLHIAQACARRAAGLTAGPVMLLATRGTLCSAFHQRALEAAGVQAQTPGAAIQDAVDACIAAIRAGELPRAAAALARALAGVRATGIATVVLGSSELCIARPAVPPLDLVLIDSTLELARCVVQHACEAGAALLPGPEARHVIRGSVW